MASDDSFTEHDLKSAVAVMHTLASTAKAKLKQRAELAQEIGDIECQIGELHNVALMLTTPGIKPGDIVQDEMGVKYRVTYTRPPVQHVAALTDKYMYENRSRSCGQLPTAPTAKDYEKPWSYEGVRLTKTGVPATKNSSRIYGKLTKVEIYG